MRAVLAGLGAREALSEAGVGTVTASFARACYVEMASLVVALVAPDVHAGPLHVVLDEPPPQPRPGTVIRVEPGRLAIGEAIVDLTTAADWVGALPTSARVRERAEAVAEVALSAADRSALRSAPFSGPAARARDLLERGHLGEAAAVLGGLGPGLTPSGDDALAGIVFAYRAALGPAVEPVTGHVAREGGSAFGRAAIACAVRGQALAPVHELVSAAVAGHLGAGRTAAAALAAVGETSGADLLEGLGWVLSGAAVYALAASEGLELEPAAIAR
jgi:hypothetical protein